MKTEEEFAEYLSSIVYLGKEGVILKDCDPKQPISSKDMVEAVNELRRVGKDRFLKRYSNR